MRKMVWFTLGLGAACAFCAYCRTLTFLILPSLLCAVLAALLRRNVFLQKAALVALGISVGIFWFSRFEMKTLQPVSELDGVTQEAVIRCTGFPEKTDYGYRVDGLLEIEEKRYQVLCYLDCGEDLSPGMLISGPFRFRYTAPGSTEESTYYQGEGIFLLAYQEDTLTVIQGETSWQDYPAIFRQKVLGILKETLPEDAAVFAKALLLGETSGLDYRTKTDFTVSGIRHIIAVSGLHVSILFSLVNLVSLRKRLLAVIIGFPVLVLFAAITGFTPSVCRACIMSGLMLLASLLDREYDGPTSLSFAALVLLLVNPLVVTSVSYQLSFASVAGIFLFSPGIRKWLLSVIGLKVGKKLCQYIAASVSVTLGATVLTLPFCAWYFGAVSLAAVVTNLLVLWAVSMIFYGLIALCVLHSFWSTGAMLLGRCLSVLIRYVLLTAKIIADFPLAAVYTCSLYITGWLIFSYLLLAVFLLSKNKKPITFCCCMILGLCISLLASWVEPLMDDVRFTVLDVGQGQCLLLQSEGKAYMVDCGGSSDAQAADAAAEKLLSQGVSRLDALILTHCDRDHAGGVENLLSRIDTDLLVLPARGAEISAKAERILYAREDILLVCADTKIRIFSSLISANDNESSLCILFDSANCDILITGDRSGFGERMLLRDAEIQDVDVLVAGHHGSKNATCEELLAAVRPEIVCISAGRNNPFGHPAKELLQRLEEFGCAVYRTDLHGDILIRR